ncbi:recombinase family protein [Tautonia plasticadhaerens]|uniref:DNA-invertase hin n=1 Tax=Tautonia plasticadhaerens TaxID=2527974 RepID=A0A518GZN9_9BACT|nr:recombinase family protein [Tautonia plasticadhaerens]QDV34043.1 DNA-invertase hin [Tautonia plasticadhaerens]
MRAVGYVRVSTQEQSQDGVSLASQREKVVGYAALYGLELVAVEEDAGASAKTLDRPALARALALIDRGEADGLLVAKLDRLTRSVADLDTLIRRYFGEPAGKQLWSVADAIDTRTAAGRLVLNVLMSVAQWERETIGERTRDALAYKRSQGERTGQIPYGRRLSADGVHLEADDGELALLDWIRSRKADGHSLRAIARELGRMGAPTKNGGAWSKTTVGRLLQSKAT